MRRMKLSLTVLLMILASALFAACAAQPTTEPQPVASLWEGNVGVTPSAEASDPLEIALPAEDISRRWLQKVPCAAPCWEGITPGVTTLQEATRILSGPPLYFDVQRRDRSPYPSFLTWENSDHFWGSVYFDHQGPALIASQVDVGVAEPFTIGEVMAAYGEPGFIAVYASPEDDNVDRFIYGLAYVYPDDGLDFYILGTRAPLKPEGKSNHIRFFQPLPGNFASTPDLFESIANLPELVPWDGFKSFRAYCVEAYPVDYEWRCPTED